MSATNFLDNFYSVLSNATRQLYFFPYSSANKVLTGCRARQNVKEINRLLSDQPSLQYANVNISAYEAQNYSNGVMLLLTPILFPLTIATFAFALAIDIFALLTKLITYPIASVLDSVFLKQPQ